MTSSTAVLCRFSILGGALALCLSAILSAQKSGSDLKKLAQLYQNKEQWQGPSADADHVIQNAT